MIYYNKKRRPVKSADYLKKPVLSLIDFAVITNCLIDLNK
jgi:hypothetical protein